MKQTAIQSLYPLLRGVSRSFYKTLRVLPARVGPQIGVAYLLARATDTIADTELVPVADRLAMLDQLRGRIQRTSASPLEIQKFFAQSSAPTAGSAGERQLLERIEEVLAVLKTFDQADRHCIRAVLDTIASGQELDLRRFEAPGAVGASGGTKGTEGSASESKPRPAARAASDEEQMAARPIVALPTEAELDDYLYRVAGCVGEFWTKLCRASLFPRAPLDDAVLLTNGVRFGKGLQLVNVLRDLPRDLRQGRCYVPRERLTAAGLTPEALLDPANMPRFRSLYDQYVDLAQVYLADGWAYTNLLPRGQVRLRLACAWPILIGLRTLVLLRESNVLDPGKRLKISRAEVRGVFVRSVLCSPWRRAWAGLFDWAAS